MIASSDIARENIGGFSFWVSIKVVIFLYFLRTDTDGWTDRQHIVFCSDCYRLSVTHMNGKNNATDESEENIVDEFNVS